VTGAKHVRRTGRSELILGIMTNHTLRALSGMRTRLCASVVVLTLLALGGCGPDVPTVDEMVAHYEANRAGFGRIARSIPPDGSFRVDLSEGAVASDGVSAFEAAKYVEMLREVDATYLQSWEGDFEVLLGSEGLAVSGVDWGYFHSTEAPDDLVTLEEARSWNAPRLWYYPLGDGWYAKVYSY